MSRLFMSLFFLLVGLMLLSIPAGADTAVPSVPALTSPADKDLSAAQQQLQSLQGAIDAAAKSGTLKPEAVTALQGQQQELNNRVAKLQAAPTVTPDEKAALTLGIQTQQERLARYSQAAMLQMRRPDPASLPPTTYVAPNGSSIIAPAGNANNSGVVTIPGNGPVTSQ